MLAAVGNCHSDGEFAIIWLLRRVDLGLFEVGVHLALRHLHAHVPSGHDDGVLQAGLLRAVHDVRRRTLLAEEGARQIRKPSRSVDNS
jgi:hypothetical protein